MAANRAAKAASSAPPAPSSTAPTSAPPEKKLSKLQQKMLSARSARPQPGASTPAPVDPSPAPGAPAAVKQQPEPMSLDEPVSALFGASPALVAAPSSFASALAPASSSALGAGAVPLARRLATSISVTGGVAPTQVGAFGPSPDDKVLEARRGTALAGAGGAAKVPVRR